MVQFGQVLILIPNAMKDQIKTFILNKFPDGEGELSNSTSLFSAGIIDSLKLMELIAFCEKTFNISINMDEVTINNFDSVNNICKLIDSKKSKK